MSVTLHDAITQETLTKAGVVIMLSLSLFVSGNVGQQSEGGRAKKSPYHNASHCLVRIGRDYQERNDIVR